MSQVSRRHLFKSAVAGGAATGLFSALEARKARAGQLVCNEAGYGNLRSALPLPTPALSYLGPSYDAVPPILMLPRGFVFSVVSVQGMPMSDLNQDGVPYPTPGTFDGMEAFPLPNGNIRLIRNHEDRQSAADLSGPLVEVRDKKRGPRAFAYDSNSGGGTTSLEVEPHGLRKLVGSHWSLVGTNVNCGGGRTTYGTWITCEETTDRRSSSATGFQKKHGYCFEVAADTSPGAPTVPTALTGLGRFVHEAIGMDDAGNIYLTEDNSSADTCLFRWSPPAGEKPTRFGDLAAMHSRGSLWALKVVGVQNKRLYAGVAQGTTFQIEWVPVANPDPDYETTSTLPSPAAQGIAQKAAIFKKAEGVYMKNGKVFFTTSASGSGGAGQAGVGQVWELDVAAQRLRLVYDAGDFLKLDAPDNICVTPRGGLILCEDGDGAQYLRGLTDDGRIFDFARNVYSGYEFAGACFSPDGHTLFVNIFSEATIQSNIPYSLVASPAEVPAPVPPPVAPTRIYTGPDQAQRALTLAIWGPWQKGCL
jgi:hypothetical protein